MLMTFGYFTIYSSSYSGFLLNESFWDNSYGKQMVWIIISIVLGSVILLIEGSFIQNSSYVFYLIIVILLITVLFMPAVKGAKSWFQFGGFSIQPSEFAKLGCSLAFARYLSLINTRTQNLKNRLTAGAIVMIPALLIMVQPDPGTMLVFIGFVFVLYREGLSGNFLLIGLFAVLIAVVGVFFKASGSFIEVANLTVSGNLFFGIILVIGFFVAFLIIKYFVLPRYRREKYIRLVVVSIVGISISLSVSFIYDNLFKERHRNRFQIMFGIKEDRKGDGYNIYQALSAIGSGETFGKGYLNGTLSNDKFKHVPEQNTDFIFCVLAEEWGFFGCFTFVCLYASILIRMIMIAERQRSKFTRIYGYCVTSILFFHFMINVGMVIGLAPVIGIPLPFFSKGGSAVLAFSLMISILLRLDAERKVVLR